MWIGWFIQWYLFYIVSDLCMNQLIIHFGPSRKIISNVSVNTLPPTPQIPRSVTASEEVWDWDFSYVFLTNVEETFWKIKVIKITHTNSAASSKITNFLLKRTISKCSLIKFKMFIVTSTSTHKYTLRDECCFQMLRQMVHIVATVV
jgi:hypothetical protein